MKKILFVCIFALGVFASQAQYKHSLGLGFGSSVGVQYKGFLNDKNAIDLMLGGLGTHFDVSGVYEWHFPVADEWKWYVGPGVYLGSWNDGNDSDRDDGFYMGIMGAIGIEFKPAIPFVFSLDYRPSITLAGWSGYYSQFVFGVRYVF